MNQASVSQFASQILNMNSLNWILLVFFITMIVIWLISRVHTEPAVHRGGSPVRRDSQGFEPIHKVSMNELIDIEESLLALKELYVNRLISSEIFVSESLRCAKRLEGE